MKIIRVLGILTGATLAVSACDLKSIVSQLDKKTDAGPTADAGPMGACNAVVNGASMVSKTTNAGPTPTMTGGTIVDGTYFLTHMDRYNGSTGSSVHQETWGFSGGNVQIVTLKDTDGTTLHYSGTYATADTTMTLNVTCPGVQSLSGAYTATATQLVLVNADDANETHTFTKQ